MINAIIGLGLVSFATSAVLTHLWLRAHPKRWVVEWCVGEPPFELGISTQAGSYRTRLAAKRKHRWWVKIAGPRHTRIFDLQGPPSKPPKENTFRPPGRTVDMSDDLWPDYHALHRSYTRGGRIPSSTHLYSGKRGSARRPSTKPSAPPDSGDS